MTITTPGPNAAAMDQPFPVNLTASVADGFIVSYVVRASGATLASGTTGLPLFTLAGTPFSGATDVTFTSPNIIFQLTVRVTASY